MAIPIIDIFAGPGGLGEGFSSFLNWNGKRVFKIALSIEKEFYAHQTLTLRSFFRQFEPGKVPEEYYQFIKGEIDIDTLYKKYSKQAKHAKNEAWHAKLGEGENAVTDSEVDFRIEQALKGNKNWLLIGGPPCQAYSVVGRVRRQEKVLDESKDERVGLYKQYLRILAVHNPSIFVMENVKGLLSAETKDSPVFSNILRDLGDPAAVYRSDPESKARKSICPGYKIYSLVTERRDVDLFGKPVYQHKDYVIHAEKYGIPQTRHRVILLGIRNDINAIPGILKPTEEVGIEKVLTGLPKLRSGISRKQDTAEEWKEAINEIAQNGLLKDIEEKVKEEIRDQLNKIRLPDYETGAEYIPYSWAGTDYRRDWYIDERLGGVCNHSARAHMVSDLHRYFYIACFTNVKGFSPSLEYLPESLLPNHKNVYEDKKITRKFADRFKVQLRDKASKTITSHISQDGHYYIHYDPTQCRSFTVREAARIQTFPDNYYFCGPRTSQFIQVGNAVPPLLANQISEIIAKLMA